jgi:phosphate transport system permease protein
MPAIATMNTTKTFPTAADLPSASMVAVAKKQRFQDALFHRLTQSFSLLVLIALVGIIGSLFYNAWPTFAKFGAHFLWYVEWDIINEEFGAAISIVGTVLSAGIALVLAVPLAFGIAVFLTETCPVWLRRPLGTAIELLAAVPSIIYGMWGFFVIAPAFAKTLQPWIIENIGELPLIGFLFQGAPFGTGLFTAAFILAIMILPFIAATMRDVFEQVPPVFKESAYGLGATKWEVMKGVVLPYTRISVVGGIMLGLGRALGETMAVTFVIGNANRISTSLFGPGNTIASLVALEFGESEIGSLKLASLLALGFILFVLSFAVLATSRYLLRSRLKV